MRPRKVGKNYKITIDISFVAKKSKTEKWAEKGAVNLKPWRFQEQMAFLIPYTGKQIKVPPISRIVMKRHIAIKRHRILMNHLKIKQIPKNIEQTQGDEAVSQIHT